MTDDPYAKLDPDDGWREQAVLSAYNEFASDGGDGKK